MASDDIIGPFLKPRPETQWDDVIGLEEEKKNLLEHIILPIKFPQLFTGGRKPMSTYLLYGPPGTGKSLLARALASRATEVTFLHISSSDIVSKYNDGEKMLKELFDKARKKNPSIILIDDVDQLQCNWCDEGREYNRRVKTEFLIQMSGHCGLDNSGVFVVCTTNVPDSIDAAMRRRLLRRIPIPPPDTESRGQMFKYYLGQTTHNLTEKDFKTLADMSDGFTGSDICCVVKDAQLQPIRKLSAATHFKKVSGISMKDPDVTADDLLTPCAPDDPDAIPMTLTDIAEDRLLEHKITMEIVSKTVSKFKPTVTQADIDKMDEFTRDFGPL